VGNRRLPPCLRRLERSLLGEPHGDQDRKGLLIVNARSIGPAPITQLKNLTMFLGIRW